ncbi:helix-turn-helix transcriptional regulator [Tessaracoccus terricola]
MTTNLPQPFDHDAPVFPVSVAASLADMHPQTLRGYDRLGLVIPRRARGRGRRNSLRDIARLRHIQRLNQDEGINLEGIRRILQLEEHIETLQQQVARLNDALKRVQSSPEAARIFTAEATGDVHHGRYRATRRLACRPADLPP